MPGSALFGAITYSKNAKKSIAEDQLIEKFYDNSVFLSILLLCVFEGIPLPGWLPSVFPMIQIDKYYMFFALISI